jgi:hypothetical protein
MVAVGRTDRDANTTQLTKKKQLRHILPPTMHFFLAKLLLFALFLDFLLLNKGNFQGMTIQTSALTDCSRFFAAVFLLERPVIDAIALMSPGPSAHTSYESYASGGDIRCTMANARCKSTSISEFSLIFFSHFLVQALIPGPRLRYRGLIYPVYSTKVCQTYQLSFFLNQHLLTVIFFCCSFLIGTTFD